MGLLASNALTIKDHAKRLDPKGKIAVVAELLSESNEILDDMLFIEGNLPTGHRQTVRTGLPSVFWKILNQGVQPSKSLTAQIDEQCGMLEAWSEVDKDVAELAGNTNAFRLSEASAFIEAMSQEAAATLIYGNGSVSPEEFNGLAIRYSDLSATNAQNILDAGGTQSDNTSIYLVVWGEQTVCGVFPQGSKAGLEHENLGLVTVQETNGIAGNRMRAYQDRFHWKLGLSLKDHRYVVRIANIDVSNLIAESSNADLIKFMIKAIHRIPNLNMGKACFYMNRTVFQMLDIQRHNAVAGAGMTYAEVDGKVVPNFRGIPLKKIDALLETEARVV